MGGCSSRSAVAPEKEATLLMLGLDNSGKTTILANLNGESTEGATPSVGFSSTKLNLDGFQVTFYDVGGGSRLRNIWQNYYSEASGSIFVVDASDHSRLTEAKEALNRVTEHDRMRGKPVLIFANKQDCEGAVNEDQLGMLLIPVDPQDGQGNLSRVVKCIALKSTTSGKADLPIRRGVKWLLGQISRNFGQISERVNADVAVQRTMEIQKRKERSERVRVIKEERERQQQIAGVVEVEELDGEPLENPFKPIKQAADETEAREKAAKGREKEVQEWLKNLQDTDQAGETTCAVTTEELSEPRLTGAGVQIASVGVLSVDRCVDGGSHSTSGLSASSNSLTDVTPESHSSAESLHEQPPPPTVNIIHHTVADVQAIKMTSAKGEKRKRRSTLLSRLKARSKTAPLLITSDQAITNRITPNAFTNQGTSPDTWTAPGNLDPAESTTEPPALSTPKAPPISGRDSPTSAFSTAQSSPLLVRGNNMQGLPDLPRSRVILPPLRLTKEPVGMSDKVLHTKEDIAVIPQESIIRLSGPPSLAPPIQPLQ